MTLLELLSDLENLDDGLTIYVKLSPTCTPTCEAIAVALEETSTASPVPEAKEMHYLVEVSIAKEVVEVWKAWRRGRVPSPKEICDAVIYYAERDAYLPV